MKRIFSLGVMILLLCSMILGVVPASAALIGPYNFEKGTIQDVKVQTTKSLGRGKATYYQTLVTSLMHNEEKRVQSYNTHVVVGTNEAEFFVYSAKSDDDMSYGLKTTLDIAKDFEKANPEYQVIAAINADFFNTSTGEPESPMIEDGAMLKSYILQSMTGRGMLGIDDTTGKLVYHTIGNAYKTSAYGTTFDYDGKYKIQVFGADKATVEATYDADLAAAPTSTQISFTTSDYGNGAYAGKTVYVVDLESYRMDTGAHNKKPSTNSYYYAYGKIVEVVEGTDGMKPESGKAYIAVENDTQAPKLVVGAYVQCQKMLKGAWANVSNAVGFKQQILANGTIVFETAYSRYHHNLNGGGGDYGEKPDYYCPDCKASKAETEKWTEDLYDYPMCWKSRTAVGFKANGDCVLMTLDKSNEGGWGATYAEIAAQLKALGCFNGFLLDGGGSSTMVIRQGDELKTVYKGENGTTGEGRVVANAIILAIPKQDPLKTEDITAAIEKASAMKKDDYTADDRTWSALEVALDEAKTILVDDASTQEWIDMACESLVSAIETVEKTKKPAETTPPETEAPKQTDAPATDEVPEPAVDNSGCGSSISLAATATVCAIGAIAVKKKRKK